MSCFINAVRVKHVLTLSFFQKTQSKEAFEWLWQKICVSLLIEPKKNTLRASVLSPLFTATCNRTQCFAWTFRWFLGEDRNKIQVWEGTEPNPGRGLWPLSWVEGWEVSLPPVIPQGATPRTHFCFLIAHKSCRPACKHSWTPARQTLTH